MKEPKYKIGDFIVASNPVYANIRGRIAKIEQSTGTYKGWLYQVENDCNYFCEKDVIRKIDTPYIPTISPTQYLDKLNSLLEDIEGEVYKLVMANGKEVGDNVVFTNFTTKYGVKCLVVDTYGHIKKVTKLVITNPKKCQVRGHLLAYDERNKIIELTPHNKTWHNVYSHIYHKLFWV